ncbi:hypothetical protein [Candidatus Nanohalococcus occultus]|uniref:hypothetical protein n=1 Tax=Candidatus Nanohalococcus occultus TaxID=2978047 RepID=UPI0039DF94EE
MATKLIIPPENPKLDGVAAAFGYSEYLKKHDESPAAAAFGEPDKQAKYLLDNVEESISDASYHLYSMEEIVIVDASHMRQLSTRIKPGDVKEIINNKDDELQEDIFTEASFEIEDVAATSTIIAEKFKNSDTEISEQAAKMLYGAIVFATDDLESENTTDRDREMAEWLKGKLEIEDDFLAKLTEGEIPKDEDE